MIYSFLSKNVITIIISANEGNQINEYPQPIRKTGEQLKKATKQELKKFNRFKTCL